MGGLAKKDGEGWLIPKCTLCLDLANLCMLLKLMIVQEAKSPATSTKLLSFFVFMKCIFIRRTFVVKFRIRNLSTKSRKASDKSIVNSVYT